jgi:hypothetical protein
MLITKKSIISGATTSREIDILPEDLKRWEAGGVLIQSVFPHLSADDREFLMSGITPEEWEEHFSEEDEYPDQDHYDEWDEAIWRDEDRIGQRLQ